MASKQRKQSSGICCILAIDSIRPKQFKDRIKKWDLNKNIQQNEMKAMIRKQKRRLSITTNHRPFEYGGGPLIQKRLSGI